MSAESARHMFIIDSKKKQIALIRLLGRYSTQTVIKKNQNPCQFFPGCSLKVGHPTPRSARFFIEMQEDRARLLWRENKAIIG